MTVLETLKDLFEASLQPTPTVIGVGFLIVLLLPVVLHFVLAATTPYTSLPAVLLVGPSGAGKTALLTLFERGPLSQQKQPSEKNNNSAVAATHTSQTPATVELAVPTSLTTASSFRDDLDATGAEAKKFLLVDTPGHAKLRGHALSRLSPPSTSTHPSAQNKLKAVVFVVDAAALTADESGDALSSTAEYLYDVLLALQKRTAAKLRSGGGGKTVRAIPVLVAANKLDLFTALPAALVKSNLEAELGRIRRTRSKGLLDSGVKDEDDLAAAGDESDDWLGEYGSDKFTFKQMQEFEIDVDVLGGNVVGDGPGADKWWRWIAERI